MKFILFVLIFFRALGCFANEPLLLKKHFDCAEPGDYIVISQSKNLTFFHILASANSKIIIEEITLPANLCNTLSSWTDWLKNKAPHSTSWVHYQIDLQQGTLSPYYSMTNHRWFTVPEGENFLQTLLKLSFYPVPEKHRKKIGLLPRGNDPDLRAYWQPPLIVNGKEIQGAQFDAFYASWPQDGGPLSGKQVEIYIPQNSSEYPSYFPYWLQIRGVLGPAKVRIINSGKDAQSPFSSPFMNNF